MPSGKPVAPARGGLMLQDRLEAQVLIEDWRIEYNTKRPHSSLGWLAPSANAERWGLSNTLDSHKRWSREGGAVTASGGRRRRGNATLIWPLTFFKRAQ